MPANASQTSTVVTTLEAALFPLVGLLTARYYPHLSSSAAQALVILAGLVAGGIVRAVRIVSENGITAAGLSKSVSEEEAWVKANAPAIKASYDAAVPALEAVKGGAAAVTAAQTDLAAAVKLYDTVPAAQREAAIAVLREFLPTLIPATSADAAASVVPAERLAVAVPVPAPVVGVNV